jgi:hypothetical protein
MARTLPEEISGFTNTLRKSIKDKHPVKSNNEEYLRSKISEKL